VVSLGFTQNATNTRVGYVDLLGQRVAVQQSGATIVMGALPTVNYGATVTLTATVSPVGVSGWVQFYTNGVALGSPVALSGGQARYGAGQLETGSYEVTAQYIDELGDAVSNSRSVALTVSPASAATISLDPTTHHYLLRFVGASGCQYEVMSAPALKGPYTIYQPFNPVAGHTTLVIDLGIVSSGSKFFRLEGLSTPY
jgi:hypothetical protein